MLRFCDGESVRKEGVELLLTMMMMMTMVTALLLMLLLVALRRVGLDSSQGDGV